MADGNFAGRATATRTQPATFDLDRFSWDAPDALGVAGTFAGLGELPHAEPVLVVRSADRELRLPAVADTVSGPPADGQPWRARFAWQEAPVAFDAVTLALGEDVTVELPEPGASRPRFRRKTLEVRRVERAPEAEAAEPETAEPEAAPPEPQSEPVAAQPDDAVATEPQATSAPAAGVERLRLEANLLAAQEQAREMAVEVERTKDELARARADLDAERERSSADAQRYREGLARVSGSVEEAVAAERGAAAQLRVDVEQLQSRLTEHDAALDELRRERDAIAAARDEAENHAGSLRDRIDELERTSAEVVELRAELERKTGQTAAAVDALAAARTATDESRADAARLLNRLTAIVEALGPRE
jgi:hypothetical protein